MSEYPPPPETDELAFEHAEDGPLFANGGYLAGGYTGSRWDEPELHQGWMHLTDCWGPQTARLKEAGLTESVIAELRKMGYAVTEPKEEA